jgi:ABC-type sugar transport system substrate-binding protein
VAARASRPANVRERRPRALLAVGAFLAAVSLVTAAFPAASQPRRYTIAFANITEEPGNTLEGTGFTGADVRQSFLLAARGQPIDLVLYDNQKDAAKALANVADAIQRKVDLYIQYFPDPATNKAVAEMLRNAGIPALAVNHPVTGAPLYGVDNRTAGQVAGEALARFAGGAWRGQPMVAILLGNLTDQANGLPERVQGVREPLTRLLPATRIIALDTRGNPAQVSPLLGKAAAASPNTRLLIAALDDTTALSAKSALDALGRTADAAIVGLGCDRSVHGGASEKKEIDPNNRGSILIGSVAFFLDRYGYDVLPLALRMLRGESVPGRTPTRHTLITAANVWREYPPYDMQ